MTTTTHGRCYRDGCWCRLLVGRDTPLGHEVGLPLFLLFNQEAKMESVTSTTTIPPYFYRPPIQSHGSDDVNDDGKNMDRTPRFDDNMYRIPTSLESVFLRCFSQCYNGSSINNSKGNIHTNKCTPHITEHLSNEINRLYQGKIRCTHHYMVQSKNNNYNKKRMVDMVLTSVPSSNQTPSSSPNDRSNIGDEPLAIFEIGFRRSRWWQRFENGGHAVKTILESNKYPSNRPILLFILAYRGTSKGMAKKTTYTTSSDINTCRNDQRKEYTIYSWGLGVFLCWKSDPGTGNGTKNWGNSDTCCTTLLWRTAGESLQTLSTAFGKTLYATHQLAHWRDQKDERYASLGSHYCCYTYPDGQQTVLQCYDNRFRPTRRTPMVYLQSNTIFGSDDHRHKLVSHVSFLDRKHTKDHDYGQQSAYSYCSDGEWLWHWYGNFTVIAIPYLPGYGEGRMPNCAGDFLPIIRDLYCLHKSSIVHGDIQLSNMAFTGPTTDRRTNCALINFDRGGCITTDGASKGSNPVYPINYEVSLRECLVQREGWPNEDIKMRHDWISLVRIIFIFYFHHPTLDITEEEEENNKEKRIMHIKEQNQIERLFENVSQCDEELQVAIDRLNSYIHSTRDWTFGNLF